MVGFNRELCVELTVDCFDHLADGVVDASDACRDLFFLVSARLGEQADALDYTMLVPRKFHPGQHHAPHLINHPH